MSRVGFFLENAFIEIGLFGTLHRDFLWFSLHSVYFTFFFCFIPILRFIPPPCLHFFIDFSANLVATISNECGRAY